MTKKHLIELAALVKQLSEEFGDKIPAGVLQNKLAQLCADSNPRFDFARFEAACTPSK